MCLKMDMYINISSDVQRQAEKEAEHTEEKGEKSVLGDLKAKKEELAKTPKKETIDKGAKSKGGEAL